MLNKIINFIGFPFSRKLESLQYLYCRFKTQLFYKIRFKEIGKGSVIRRPLFLTPEFITLGQNVKFSYDSRIEAINTFSGKSYSPHIIIEDGVSFQQRCHITAAGILLIGKNTIASFDVMITDIDHEYQDINVPIGLQPLNVKQTTIGENCFLGAGVKIQAGTTLGKQCIVGANAVVRGEFPDYCVIAGVPARILKRYNKNTSKWDRV